MPRIRVLQLVAIIAIGTAGSALAQQAQAPTPRVTGPQAPAEPRATGGLFGGLRPPDPRNTDRSNQQFTFSLDAGGGYDWQPGETVLSNEIQQVGAIAVSSAELRHRVGNSQKYLESSARGNVSFARVGVEQQESGNAQVAAAVPFGRRAGLSIEGNAAYQPTYLFNAYGALAPQIEDGIVPGTDLTEGFTQERWLVVGGSARLHRNWTSRQRMEISYSASQREGVEVRRTVSSQQSAGLRHEWSYRERSSLWAGYRYDKNREFENLTDLLPLEAHRVNLGVRMQKMFPRQRSISLSLGGGATQSRTRTTATAAAVDFVVPSAQVSVQSQMSAAWSLSVDGTHDVTMLEGLSPRQFVTNAGAVSLEGWFGRHVQFHSSAAYSRGITQYGTTGEFETMVGSVRLQFPVSRMVGLSTSYSYYGHQLYDLPELSLRLLPRQQRHSARIGLHLWLPLFGTF